MNKQIIAKPKLLGNSISSKKGQLKNAEIFNLLSTIQAI